MKFEVLKKNNLKRNIVIGGCVVLIISAVVLNFTRAKYRSTASVPIVDSEINYVRPDLEIIALYIDGVQAEELDSNTNYTLDTASSTCTYKDGSNIDNLTLSYDSDTKTFTIAPYTTRGTKCTLYFEEAKPLLADIIKGYNQSTRNDFSTVYTASTTNTVFTANDGDGTTYYFAGAPTDNYVSFAGFYWRIIRVNGDGSIRLIYQGSSADSTGGNATIGYSTFNSSTNRSEYVGLKYTQGSQYGTNTSSTIYTALNTWYTTNIANKNYGNYIDTNAGFCGDRDMRSGSTWESQPSSDIYYAARGRLNTNKSPVFTCSTNNLYTATTSNKGNKSLSSPIGLITADEVAFAGGVNQQTNEDYYLHTGSYYWTMSPAEFNASVSFAIVFYVDSDGWLIGSNVNIAHGVRPVINLKSTTTISSGNGTAQNPFIVD